MFKVMLVDDENLIVEGLKNIIDWDNLGLEVVNTASNGEEAIRKFKELPVDIVITDINMPKVTGIELLRSLKDLNDDVKFIVLSGYDEFSYAKSAIELGVKSYILKPVNEEELEEALLSIIEEVNKEKKKEKGLLEKNNKLIDFLGGRVGIDEIIDIKDIITLDFNSNSYIASNISFKADDIESVIENIDNTIREYEDKNFEIIRNYDSSIVLIKSLSSDISRESLKEYFELIKNTIKEDLNIDVFISVGNIVDSAKSISESYRECRKIKKHILSKGYGNIVFFDEILGIKEEKKDFKKEIEEINKLIIEKKPKEIETYIKDIFENQDLTPKNIYDFSIKVLFLTDEVLSEFKLSNKYTRESLSSTIVDLCNEDTRVNIENFLITELCELIKIVSNNANQYSPVVQQVINLINEDYKNELSLKTLSAKYNINSSYLGQIFTKEVGCSFSDYLNKVKNTKAKELILTTNMKINNIAKEVGYTDTSYFYRKFKKYYGVCPSTLREMKNY